MLYCAFSNAAKWDESKHKRAKDGKFAKTAGEGSGKSESVTVGDIGSKADPSRGRKWEQKYDVSDSLRKAVDSVADKLSDREKKAVQDNIEKLSRAGTPERAQAKAELIRNLLKRKGVEVDEKDLVKSLGEKAAEDKPTKSETKEAPKPKTEKQSEASASETGANVSFVDPPDAYSNDKYLAPPLFGASIPRGAPMNHVQANELKANPKFLTEAGYQQNCQLCVPAYELRRRGYDLEAKSSTDKVSQELATTSYWNDVRGEADNVRRFPWQRPDGEPQKPFYLDHITTEMLRDNGKQLYQEMRKPLSEKATQIEEMVKANAGTRFALSYYYTKLTARIKSMSGHTVTILKGSDGVSVYDPQNGTTTSLAKWARELELQDCGAMCCVTRIDNARINPRYEFGFTKATGKAETAPKLDYTALSDKELMSKIMDMNRTPKEKRNPDIYAALKAERKRRQDAASAADPRMQAAVAYHRRGE